MTLEEALKLLGTSRVIWIDDHFNDSAVLLADMLWQNIETTKQCDFDDLRDAVGSFDFNPDDALAAMRQILTDVGQARRDEIKQDFLKRQQVNDDDPTEELTTNAIERACELLGVLKDDRWSFDGVDARLKELCTAGDEAVSYMIDLKNSAGGKDDTRGLEIIVDLHRLGSKGTAFILTHEATEADEAGTEKRLLESLEAEVAKALPLCVVSKHRIAGDSETEVVKEALRVAIKRAGLRRSVHEVLARARNEVSVSFSEAASSLLRIAPEQLDSHVVGQAYREGVSELHVIERALTGFISQQIRTMFGTDGTVLRASERLRDLREIPLISKDAAASPELAAFSKAEIWESDSLINAALTPIACGDVFQVDNTEPSAKSAKSRRFVLLGQPCDIALRPSGSRDSTVATLVEIIETDVKSAGKEKEYTLPVTIDGKYQVCDFRNSATVLLSILDLASFRKDGRISYEEGQEKPNGLLPGLKSIFETRTQHYGALIAAGKASAEAARESELAHKAAAKAAKEAGQVVVRAANKPVETVNITTFQRELMLAFAAPDAFKYIDAGIFGEAVKIKENKIVVLDRPARVTWRLRRVGRIRAPYADAILDRMVGVISRRAFDLDFMKSPAQRPNVSEPAVVE